MGMLIVGLIGIAVSAAMGGYSMHQTSVNAKKQEQSVDAQKKRQGEAARGQMLRMATAAGKSALQLRGAKLKNRAVHAYGEAHQAAQTAKVSGGAAKGNGAIFKA